MKPAKSPYQEIHERKFYGGKKPLEKPLPKEIERGAKDIVVYSGHGPEQYMLAIETMQGPEAREAFKAVLSFASAVREAGGVALLVGGSVRDEVLGKPSKDFDIEVYKLPPEEIERIASGLGKVNAVGKAFGILKLQTPEGYDIDVSLPRLDSKIAEGHRGFTVKVDPDMTIRDAARRRDFTFNALAKNPLDGKIYDAFGGIKDLSERRLRVTDPERFRDDPLRVMRAAQFIGRFGLRTDPDSLKIMQGMLPEMKTLPRERLGAEWDKMLLKSERSSLALQALNDIGVIAEYYPELAAMHDTPQEFEWHPEGDVWVHTLMVVDAAKEVARTLNLSEDEERTTLFASLCHDLGKPIVTEFKEGRIRAHGHEPAGEKPTVDFLERIGTEKKLIEKVIPLVRDHLWPGISYLNHLKGEEVSDGSIRRLAKRIAPATIAELTYVSEADHRGRGPFNDPKHFNQFLLPSSHDAGAWLRERAEALGVTREKPKPILQGRDLLLLGLEPSREFGEIILLAEKLRDEKNIKREELLELIVNHRTIKEITETIKRQLEH